jgi:tetratricopeptide (TPR) repeat protein
MGSTISADTTKATPQQTKCKDVDREEKEYFVITDPIGALQVDPVLVGEARLMLLSGNGDFYTIRFSDAYLKYRQVIGILMVPRRSEEDVGNSKAISNFARETKELALSTIHLALNHCQIDTSRGLGTNNLKSVIRMLMSIEGTADIDILKQLTDTQEVSSIIADSVNNIGCCKFINGDVKSAMQHYEDALQLRLLLEGEECMPYAESLQNLAVCFQGCEEWANAENLLLKALSLEKKLGLEKTTESTSTMNNLGVLYSHMKRNAEAESLLSKVVENRTATLGASHRLTLNAIGNLNVIRKHMAREADEGLAAVGSAIPQKTGGGAEKVEVA